MVAQAAAPHHHARLNAAIVLRASAVSDRGTGPSCGPPDQCWAAPEGRADQLNVVVTHFRLQEALGFRPLLTRWIHTAPWGGELFKTGQCHRNPVRVCFGAAYWTFCGAPWEIGDGEPLHRGYCA